MTEQIQLNIDKDPFTAPDKARFDSPSLPILAYDDYSTSRYKCPLYPQHFTGTGTNTSAPTAGATGPPGPIA